MPTNSDNFVFINYPFDDEYRDMLYAIVFTIFRCGFFPKSAKKFGNRNQKTKVALVFEREKYLYQQYISDLNGIDTKAHRGNPIEAIKIIRNWLQVSTGSKTIDGHLRIIKDFEEFRKSMPEIAKKANLDISDLAFTDYCLMVTETLRLTMD